LFRNSIKRLIFLFMLPGIATAGEALAGDPDALRGLCPQVKGRPEIPAGSQAAGGGAIDVSAEDVQMQREGVSTFTGNVTVIRGDQRLQSDQASYDRATEVIEAHGNIKYWDKSLTATGSDASLNIEQSEGTVQNVDYWVAGGNGHGHADSITAGKQVPAILINTDYTTCTGDVPAWRMTASRITLDRATDTGTARDATLRLRNVPVLYSPWISFPLSDTRKTGLLFPSAGHSSEGGFEFAQPWYWNIAPEQDATITPRYLEKRGLLLGAEYRYLRPHGQGQLRFEYLPNDDDYGDDRGTASLQHTESLGRGWSADVNLNYVSDKSYLEQLGNNLATSSTTHVESRGDLAYNNSWLGARARVQHYQTIDRNILPAAKPYERLPQLAFSTHLPERDRSLNYGLYGEFVSFDHDTNVDGLRLDVRPWVSFPMRSAGAFLVPRVSLWHTLYDLDGTAPASDSTPERTLPVASVDAGLFLEKTIKLGGNGYVQTLEPRLYYLYVPYESQDDIPTFDTGDYTFSYSQLFRDNRFSGTDRLGDANQVALAITTRLLEDRTGRERLRASVGQIRYFRDRKVALPTGTRLNEDSSDLIGEIATALGAGWSARGGVQWDPHATRTRKSSIDLRYLPDDRRVLNLGYRLSRDSADIEQTDVSFRWPLGPQWGVVGRWNWSLQEDSSLETVGGLEYNGCCWAFRAVGRRNLNTSTGDFNTGIYFQLELKGLAGFGSKTESFLKRSIPGYQNEF